MLNLFWPYDETVFSIKDKNKGAFKVHTPWIESEFEIPPKSQEFKALENWIQSEGQPQPNYIPLISGVLSQLSHLPIAYQLPRKSLSFGKDTHKIIQAIDGNTPREVAQTFKLRYEKHFSEEWMWDHEAVLSFSTCKEKADTYDPLSILTVGRRFHYLDCGDNKIAHIYQRVEKIKDNSERRSASALIVRQNHYVTAECQASLAPAIEIAQSQKSVIREFMNEEKGHDAILAGSLKAMGYAAEHVPLTPAVINLMSLLERCATHNFLAFCMALDFFEKPQFKNQDSLAEMLSKTGESLASRGLQAHKNINDHGEHEGFSGKLLSAMKPVTADYAVQALKMAELVSSSIAQVPHDLDDTIFKK